MFFNICPFPWYFFYMEPLLVQFPGSAPDSRIIQSSIMGPMTCTFWNTCSGLSTRIICHWLLQCLYSRYSMWQAAADNLKYIFTVTFAVMVAECCREASIVCWEVGWNVFNQHIYCGMGACGGIWIWWVGQHDQLRSSDRHLRPLYQVLPMPPYEYQCNSFTSISLAQCHLDSFSSLPQTPKPMKPSKWFSSLASAAKARKEENKSYHS